MSEVFKAFDTQHGLGTVAIKILPALRRDDKWAVKAFDLEVKARLAPLDHPSIVPLLEQGRDPDTGELYLIFPWAGETLTDVLVRRDPVPWEEWWPEYGRPIVDALAHAHRQNVAHRDVKPDNVLVGDGPPRLADFGVAKLLDNLTVGLTMTEHVSRPFAPPENDTGVHTRTRDVHAWAAMTYFAVSGVEPGRVDPDDPYAILDEAARAARAALPPDVDTVLARCTGDPATRPATAGELLSILDECCATEPETASDLGCVPVRLPPAVAQQLERDRDLFSADVHDLVLRNLRDVAIIPHGQRPGEYRLVGNDLTVHVRVASQGDALQALRITSPTDEQIENDRRRGWLAALDFTLDRAADVEAAADAVSAMIHEVSVHRDIGRRKHEEQQRLWSLKKWRQVLRALRDLQGELADPVEYLDIRRNRSGSMVFVTNGPAPRRLLQQRRTATTHGGGFPFAGDVVNVAGEEAVLRPIAGAGRDPATAGELTVDTRASLSALRRQDVALDNVLYGRAQLTGLADLLLAPDRASEARAVREPTPKQTLDDDKRTALRVGLGEPDLMVVKGPPGTGKTRFIAELVFQQLHANPDSRILLASQTHVALDNALRRVRELDPSLRLLRLAKPDEDRVSDAVSDLRLDATLETWAADAERTGRAWLSTWGAKAGVTPDNVRVAMGLEALAAERDRLDALTEEVNGLSEGLESLRTRNAATGVTSEGTGELADQLAERRSEMRATEARAREQLDQLIEMGQFPPRTPLRRVVPADLRASAAALADGSPETDRCRDLIELLGQWNARFGGTPEFTAAAVTRAQVVGGTCVGIGGVRGLQDVPFDLCIVDEASRATAPELLIPMARATRFVLVGDEHQLPPYLDPGMLRDEVLVPRGLSLDDLSTPFFSEIADALPAGNVIELNVQHRMHPAIGGLISECFYGGRLKSARPANPLPDALTAVVPKHVTWLTTAGMRDRGERQQGDSFVNDTEAQIIKRLVGQLAAAATRKHPLEVAVLTAYRGQLAVLEGRLAAEMSASGHLALSVHTVDSFQGQEAGIVIYSVTRSNPKGKLGFTRERPRVNVALSRARDLLIIVGDHASARRRHGENPMREVIEHVEAFKDECALQEAGR